MNVPQEIYETVRATAKQKKISLNKIVLACGLGQNFFVNMKNGTMPRNENLKKIADYLEVSVDFLMKRGFYMKNSEQVYNAVRECARQRGVKLSNIIRACGLGQNYFVNWKKQQTLPRAETLKKIAAYLEVSVDYLMGREKRADNDELNEYLEELSNRSEMRMFFSVAKNATKEDIEAAVAMIEALNKRHNG